MQGCHQIKGYMENCGFLKAIRVNQGKRNILQKGNIRAANIRKSQRSFAELIVAALPSILMDSFFNDFQVWEPCYTFNAILTIYLKNFNSLILTFFCHIY